MSAREEHIRRLKDIAELAKAAAADLGAADTAYQEHLEHHVAAIRAHLDAVLPRGPKLTQGPVTPGLPSLRAEWEMWKAVEIYQKEHPGVSFHDAVLAVSTNEAQAKDLLDLGAALEAMRPRIEPE